MKPLVSIIMPVWDVCDLTEQFCEAVLGHTHKPSNELIIIDNCSTDRTPYYLKAKLKEYQNRLTVITNSENLGYPRGQNQGLLLGQGDYLVCTSNDVWFYRDDWLEILINPLKINKKRLVGPRYIDWNPLTEIDGKSIPYLEGWMLAFHRHFLKDVGYFDEGFFAWYEDVDLSWRAQRHGYELVQVDTLPVKHLYGKSALNNPEKFHIIDDLGVPEISRRSQVYFRDKIRRGDDKPFYPKDMKRED